MDIVQVHVLNGQIFQEGGFHIGGILGVACGMKQTTLNGDIGVGYHRLEIVERNLFQRNMPFYTGVRLSHEICKAINSAMAGIKDCRIKMERGGINLVRLMNIADIAGLEVQMTQDQRPFRILVNIGDAGIPDFEGVYFKRVDGFHRLLPAALLDWNSAGSFTAQLLQVDVDFRLVQHEFSYQFA